MTDNIQQYLVHYAEPETSALTSYFTSLENNPPSFKATLVIPAYQESIAFVQRIQTSGMAQQALLLIVVINQPDDLALNSELAALQPALFQTIYELGTLIWQHENLTLLALDQSQIFVLLVDRFSVPIPHTQGVGLARKIGVDIALAFIARGIVQSKVIASTDADARLPDNYLTELANLTTTDAAMVFNFHHVGECQSIYQATKLYEQALRYYVAGLRYAGSSYAFYTIGSVIAIQAQAYASVRGFPKRSAGEDFYLLNKLAKVGNVVFNQDCIISIDARLSSRVPFGTGPAVRDILALQAAGHSYCYYHPMVFEYLKQLLNQFSQLYVNRQQLPMWFANLPIIVSHALSEIGFLRFVEQHQQVKQVQFERQLNVWFDAFKTLKFIHSIRLQGYADIPLSQALKEANFIPTDTPDGLGNC